MKRTAWTNKKGTWKSFKPALKGSKLPLKRTRLRKVSISSSAILKREIQALLRQLVIHRDGGCILRHFPEAGACDYVLQAEHLATRGSTNYFGDLRNIVCLCRRHHIFWKPTNSKRYWELIRMHLGETKWNWVERAIADNRPHKVDLKLVKLDLENQLRKISDIATLSDR